LFTVASADSGRDSHAVDNVPLFGVPIYLIKVWIRRLRASLSLIRLFRTLFVHDYVLGSSQWHAVRRAVVRVDNPVLDCRRRENWSNCKPEHRGKAHHVAMLFVCGERGYTRKGENNRPASEGGIGHHGTFCLGCILHCHAWFCSVLLYWMQLWSASERSEGAPKMH